MAEYTRRTRTYIAFDGDSDIMSYRTIQGWNSNNLLDFDLNDAHELNYARDNSLPESIINQLRERLDSSKNLILLVGEKTKGNRKGILKFELNYAIKNKLPIFLVFIGFSTNDKNDTNLWNNNLFPKIPTVITDAEEKYCLVLPFSKDIIGKAIDKYTNNNLPDSGFSWYWN